MRRHPVERWAGPLALPGSGPVGAAQWRGLTDNASVVIVLSETTEISEMNLTPVMTRFILHWGEMGSRWGVNRTVAQIHALLYLAPGPLPADEIAESINVARSNVSTSLKELQGWGLVNVTHVMSDRRDHFAARTDPWEMLVTIMEQRKRREIEPTLQVLRECAKELEKDRETPKEAKARIENMLGFLTNVTTWFDQMLALPKATVLTLMKLGAKVASFVPKAAKDS
jgi:DNA-binding transcriptional regulator GbsR (MarR family)